MDWEDDTPTDVEDAESYCSDYSEDDVCSAYCSEEDETLQDAIGHRNEQKFTVLSELDIRRRQQEQIREVSGVLSVSNVAASLLLCRYGWDVAKVNEEWFADEERVRRDTGLLEQQAEPPDAAEVTCRMCYEDHPRGEMSSAACGHLFCRPCWGSYIGFCIANGPGCLMLRCPVPSCGIAVGQDMVDELSTDGDEEKYSRYLLRSYVEDNKKTKWCPAPGCDFAVEFVSGGRCYYDVCCDCSYVFCWNCMEEAHRPVDCSTVAKWILMNISEAENTNWILANSKLCPECHKPIEKNQGCMHMTCRPPCGYQFCWLCLGPWSEHGEATGEYDSCNKYERGKKEGKFTEEEIRRNMAKGSVERYTHFYERWAANHSSRQRALRDLEDMKTFTLEKLADKQALPVTKLEFILEAWLQIADCRRVLKWTYAYGYYLPDHEETKKHFFEYLQSEAETGLERLHQCTEMDLKPFLDAEEAPLMEEFNDFRTKLVGLTKVTGTYFENLIRALESGLQDVQKTVGQGVAESTSMTSSKPSFTAMARRIQQRYPITSQLLMLQADHSEL